MMMTAICVNAEINGGKRVMGIFNKNWPESEIQS